MVNIIYNFIYETLIGVGTIGNTNFYIFRNLSTILTYITILLIYWCLVKFVIWMFKAPFRRMKWRD